MITKDFSDEPSDFFNLFVSEATRLASPFNFLFAIFTEITLLEASLIQLTDGLLKQSSTPHLLVWDIRQTGTFRQYPRSTPFRGLTTQNKPSIDVDITSAFEMELACLHRNY